MILAGILSLIGAGAISYVYLDYVNAPQVSLPTNTVSVVTTADKKEVNNTAPVVATIPKPVAKPITVETVPAVPPASTSVVSGQLSNVPLVPKATADTKVVATPGPLRATTTTSTNSSDLTIAGVVVYTNEARAQNGALPALKENFTLDRDAQIKLDDMFAKQYFEHVSPSGVGPSDLAQAVGYAYVTVGENLALGNFGSDQGVVTAWMNSPGHRANILNTHYQEIGVAVGKGMYEGRETWLAVQAFGMPLSSCPSIDVNLKTQIDANNVTIAGLRAQLDAKKAQIEATPTTSKQYNVYVNEFNAIVPQYNTLVEVNRANVSTYNAGVQAFNACIGSVGSSTTTSTAH